MIRCLSQNTSDLPAAGLWLGSLGLLIVGLLGARFRPSEAGLFPDPRHDFSDPGRPRPSVRTEALLAGALLLAAFGLRLYGLEHHPGFFGDEGEQGMDARAILEGARPLVFGEGWWNLPNLYFYCAAGMLRVFGDTIPGLRMLSVLSGTLSVLFVYRIGRHLWGPRAGLIAGALLATSPLALQFGRMAGVSPPTAMLWAGGFLFLIRTLRFRGWSDACMAGVLWGLSLYFYPSAKLIIPLIGIFGACLALRYRREFLRLYLPLLAALIFAFCLAFLPYALFSMREGWQGFFSRARETSIFTAEHQPLVFAKFGLPYAPEAQELPVWRSLLAQPWGWTQVLFHQMRLTVELLYRTGDPTAFYQITEHDRTMLPPLWAALTLLGLFLAAIRAWDPRFALVSLWFWGGLLGPALTMDTPSVQRLAGAWPAVMLFPALVLDSIAAAAWPLSRKLARRWLNLGLAGLLVYLGGSGIREYFVHYASLAPFGTPTVLARHAQALGSGSKAYLLGVGPPDIFFSYGSVRFLAKGVEGATIANLPDFLPLPEPRPIGADFIVYPWNQHYEPLIRLYYPNSRREAVSTPDGQPSFVSYKVDASQLAQTRAWRAVYTSAIGPPFMRNELVPGTEPPPQGLPFPTQARWSTSLILAEAGDCVFHLDLPNARLELDGAPIHVDVSLRLARGQHQLSLSAPLPAPASRPALLWNFQGGREEPIPPERLYLGQRGGLSGEVWQDVNAAAIEELPRLEQAPPSLRRVDPFLGFRSGNDSFGFKPFVARWRGALIAPSSGDYRFELRSNGPARLLLDAKPLLDSKPEQPTSGVVHLDAGRHPVELAYAWSGGRAQLEWFWSLPGQISNDLVPPEYLIPELRFWPSKDIEKPSPQAASAPASSAPVLLPLEPISAVAQNVGLLQPRGVAIAQNGELFVADAGNHRIARLDAQGSPLGSMDGFQLISDVAIRPDGSVVGLDAASGKLRIHKPGGEAVQEIPGVATSASGIDVSADGLIWIADTGASRVVCLGPTGDPKGAWTGEAEGFERFEQPIDVLAAEGGAAYVVDLRRRLARVEADGRISAQWPAEVGVANGGSHLAWWGERIAITEPDLGRLDVLDPKTGEWSRYGGFSVPVGAAAAPDGSLIVIDSGRVAIKRYAKPS